MFLKASSSETYKQNITNKMHRMAYKAIMSSLSVINDTDPNDKQTRNGISTANLLICSANFQLNRFRRCIISPFIKKDSKKSLLPHPVKHDCLFGQEYEKCTEQAIKEQPATQKKNAAKITTSLQLRALY